MNNLIRERKGMLILSLLVILLPMGLGLFLWNQLPDQVPIHFGLNGQADNYAGKAFVVFGLPLLMAALQVLLLVVTMADPKGKNIAAKPFGLLLWICPLVSLFCGTMTYAKALALPVDINLVGGLFLGLMFLVVGNYLPKCRRNYTIGIKVPWALDNEENWNATHRFAGKLWVISGAVIVVLSFLPWAEVVFWVNMAIILIAAVASGLYSFFYYKKQQREGRW